MLRGRFSAIALVSALLLTSANVRANLIINGSFEEGTFTPDFAGGDYQTILAGQTTLTGWTVGDVGVNRHKSTPALGPAHSGDFMVDLNLNGNGGDTGTLSQSFATTIGASYTLNFFLAGPGVFFSDPRQVRVQIANEDVIFSQPASPQENLVWGRQDLTFTAVDTTTTLMFSTVNGDSFWGPFLDDVSVTPIPEPTSVALLGVGLAGLFLSRRAMG